MKLLPLFLLIVNHNASKSAKRLDAARVDVSVQRLSCADCGVSITSLLLMPDPDRPVYCGECSPAAKNFGKASAIITLADAEKFLKDPEA